MVLNKSDPTVQLGDWQDLKDLALPLRISVFVQEQGVPQDLENDEYDDISIHAVIVGDDNHAIATGRLLITEHNTAKIGRLAVARPHRGQGLGKLVLRTLLEQARINGVRKAKLHAQCSAERFYRELGFTPSGAPFVEAGIDHVLMVKDI